MEFEQQLASFTGARYAIMTDCCTHAIELCLRYTGVKQCSFTAFTYLSIPMTMHKLNIDYSYLQEVWTGEYQFHGTNVWDSARRLERNMFRSGMLQCLSFGFDKPLSIGRGGAILLDDTETYNDLLLSRYDGRNLQMQPWQEQKIFKLGYHYKPTIEEAVKGLELLKLLTVDNPRPKYVQYPDLRSLTITK